MSKKDNALNYRAFQRIPCEVSIMYSYIDSENYSSAKMVNCGVGGMYFEVEKPVRSGKDIYIKLMDSRTVISELDDTDCYRAEVLWCRQNGDSYGVGVRFVTNICQQCGEKIPSREICRTDDFVYLCTPCSTQLAMLHDGKIKESIENYLIGNVV